MSKIVTIHQPDFMPWLGFFTKINKADTFVVLDHVSNRYNQRSWFRRVRLANRTSCYWLSISVEKPKISSTIPINQMRVNRKVDYTNSLKTIQQTYSKAPYYHTIYPLIEKWFNSNETLLSRRNMNFIIDVMNILGIDTKVVYSSELNCKEKSNELLIEILKLEGADIYLCGDGADTYQKDELFIAESIEVEYNNFRIKEYEQINTKKFQAGLSVIDCLMNIGSEKTKELLL